MGDLRIRGFENVGIIEIKIPATGWRGFFYVGVLSNKVKRLDLA